MYYVECTILKRIVNKGINPIHTYVFHHHYIPFIAYANYYKICSYLLLFA